MGTIDGKPKRPWTGFDYLVLLVLALIVAVFVLRPIGLQIRDVFQTLTNAFQNK